MSFFAVITRSLRFHWRINLAVALGVAAATAVLTGALLIGDSVRGSLRHLVLDRLGKIDELLVVDRFFRRELADDLRRGLGDAPQIVPAILFPSGTVETVGSADRRLASGVLVVGSDDSFWSLNADSLKVRNPGRGDAILNAPLAEELGVKVGDKLVVRLGKADQVPADSPLGRRTDRTTALAELKIIEIIPATGLGRFGLSPSQVSPRNIYVSLADMQEALEVEDKVNAIFVGNLPRVNQELADVQPLHEYLRPKLVDYGLTLKRVTRKFGDGDNAETIFDYYSLSSDRLLVEPTLQTVIERALRGMQPQPTLTYLANSIEQVGGDESASSIPYSTITAIDPAPGGPLVDDKGQPLPSLAIDEIILTSWAAADQKAKVADRVRLSYFEPETTHGEAREASAEFRVKAIVPLTEPSTPYSRRRPAEYDQRPTAANDPDLTPEVKGITDQASIADWDPPFPFEQSRIRPQDDEYWENHRTTPKAFISLAAGQKLWGSRFGRVTSFRIPAASNVTEEGIEAAILAEARKHNAELGFVFQPIKAQGLAAAAGTTPFDVLFLLLSMFIIAAGLMLVWLLFRLGIERRADEIGLLVALGWKRAKIRRLLVAEGAVVAAVGAALGILGGIAYAWLMLTGLRTWWVGAITTPFLELYATPRSLVLGFVLGLGVCVITIWFGIRRLRHAVVRSLLAGEIVLRTQDSGLRTPPRSTRHSLSSLVALLLFISALALAFFAFRFGGEAQAGAFVGTGCLLLVSLVLLAHQGLQGTAGASRLIGKAPLTGLAYRSAGRNPGRSTATLALVASSAFLIVAVSAFRMIPTEQGVGGFDLLAESSQPIYGDLNTAAGRSALLVDKADVLAGGTVLAMRLKPGDDASCQNLYQPTQPRILGVTPQTIGHFSQPNLPAKFAWSASAANTEGERANPWRLFEQPSAPDEPTPVVLDQNTAMYSLRLYGGIGQTFDVTYAGQPPVKFRVAGLLAGSVLQGNLMIGEADFKRLFPTISGYRFFLIAAPPGKQKEVASALEDRLSDEGFDVVDAKERLADLLAVQNTYISTFQSLGALGLVLGTFGLAAVQLRSVFERRKELALMRAAGFARQRLGTMVLLENLVLLVGGLALGTIAALAAILPQLLFGQAQAPLLDLTALLGVVLLVGLLTGLIAVRATMRAALVPALRGE
jgi:putative ABC transport system permease protein